MHSFIADSKEVRQIKFLILQISKDAAELLPKANSSFLALKNEQDINLKKKHFADITKLLDKANKLDRKVVREKNKLANWKKNDQQDTESVNLTKKYRKEITNISKKCKKRTFNCYY